MLICYLFLRIYFFYLLQLADDRMALVSGISLDPEAAIGVTKRLPPKWVDGADEVSWMANPTLSCFHVEMYSCC